MTHKAYVILDGGGVKGAALAGCLKAAKELNIEFLGYGGTSAGSIVALLASVGYDPDEIEHIMITEINFSDFLDDKGAALGRLRAATDRLNKSHSIPAVIREGLRSWRLVKKVVAGYGLYHGDNLQDFLLDKIRAKLPQFRSSRVVTFAELENAGCRPLKVVASDIRTSTCVVFSNRGGTDLNGSVIDAVRASMSYPFVFKPVKINSRYLVDGGLSSNLPVFLFEEERKNSHFSIPVIAFDLISPSEHMTSTYSFKEFCVDMLSTALESSDRLLRESLQGVYHVPIETPRGIGTLDFNLSTDRRQELFTKGHSEAHSYFRSKSSYWTEARTSVESLQALRGDPSLINFLLGVMAEDLGRQATATNLRANIMLPAGEDKRIVVYQHGMDNDPDIDLELATGGGCSGSAWVNRTIAIADLDDAKATYSTQWEMTPVQQNKVRMDRKTMISAPIFALTSLVSQKNNIGEFPLLGTLSLDTDAALVDTGWVQNKSYNPEIVDRIKTWADVFGKLLVEKG